MPKSAKAELIVLASPLYGDNYYKDVARDIFDFHVSYARQIQKHDDLLVLTDEGLYEDYVAALGKNHVLKVSMLDIWLRDFSLSNATHPIMFRYTAAAQAGNQDVSDEVQEELASIIEDAGLFFIESELINDGGNFVDDYAGNVVISKKFLRDNNLDEDQARKRLKAFEGINNVAFIEADEQGGLEHADGVVAFVDTNTLIINSYPDDRGYAKRLKSDLKNGLPGVEVHEIVTPYDGSDIYDESFGSACGLYTNALVTPERIYLPQFGIPEDAIALRQVKAVTSRKVIPVPSQHVCAMGGGVRCMSWQLRGPNAKKLLEHAKTKNHVSPIVSD